MAEDRRSDDDDSELDHILAEYYRRIDAGEKIDQDQFVAEHSDQADALIEFLSGEAQLQAEPGNSAPHNTPTILVGRRSAATSQPPVISYFGDYELLNEIARGGMGVVYKARQTSLNRIVAIKMILSGQMARESDILRFRTEAEAAAKLKHPRIVQIYEIGEEDDQHYFSMEYVDGANLGEMVRDYPLPARKAAQLVLNVAEAIEYAHEQGVLHRDLKPSNVLLDSRGEAKVTDFGLAKQMDSDQHLTQTGQVLGTPSYMPPEQASGNDALMGPTADVYSLGAVLYHLVTQRPPFAAATPMETIHQVINHEPVSPRLLEKDLPKDIETICQKCLQKEPHRRYLRASELVDDLQRFLDYRPLLARPVSRMERVGRWCHRNPVIAALSAIVAILLLTLGIGGPIVAVIQTELADRNKQLAIDEGLARGDAQRKTAELEAKSNQLAERGQELQDQIRMATAMRLAAQSESIRDEKPVQSLLLAIESAETTRRHDGTVLPLAHQNVLDSMAVVGGRASFLHRGPVITLTTPDKRWLVTGSPSGSTVRVWDLLESDPSLALVTINKPNLDLTPIGISPDGRRLATWSRSDKLIRVWNPRAQGLLVPGISLQGHERDVVSAEFSPDGHWLVTQSSPSNTLRLWELEAENPNDSSSVINRHSAATAEVMFAPDGRWLITRYESGALTVWRLMPGESLDSVWSDAKSYCKMSPDGRWLVAYNFRDETAYLMDLTADNLEESAEELAGHGDAIRSPIFSPDSKWMATTLRQGSEVCLWDLSVDEPEMMRFRLQGHEKKPKSFVFSQDCRWFITGSPDQTTRVWDLQSENPTQCDVVLTKHEGQADVRAIGPESRWLVTSSATDRTVRLWDLATSDPDSDSFILKNQTVDDGPVAVGPHGRKLVTTEHGGQQNTLELWDLSAYDPSITRVELRGHDAPVRSVFVARNGKWMLSISEDSTVRLWGLTSDDLTAQFSSLSGHKGWHTGVATSPDSRWLATGTQGGAMLWDLKSAEPMNSPVPLIGHEKSFGTVLKFSSDGRWLATSGRLDNNVCIWDLTSPQKPTALSLSKISLSGQSTHIQSLAITHDFSKVIAVQSDNLIMVWQLDDGVLTGLPLEIEGLQSMPLRAIVSPDGRWLIVHSQSATIQMWDLTAGNISASRRVLRQGIDDSHQLNSSGRWLVASSVQAETGYLWDLSSDDPADSLVLLRGHTAGITNVVFGPDSLSLATASRDGTTRLWDLAVKEPAVSPLVLKEDEGEVLAVAIDVNARWLCTGCSDKTARLWRLNDATGKEPPIVLRGHDNPVTAVEFSADGKWLVTSCGKRTTTGADYMSLLWNIDANGVTETPVVLSGQSQSVEANSELNTTDVATFSPDGRWLITGGGLMLLMHDLDFDSLLNAARRRAGRVVTPAERRHFLDTRLSRPRVTSHMRSAEVDFISQSQPINQRPAEPHLSTSFTKTKDTETSPTDVLVSRKASDSPRVELAASAGRENILQAAVVAAIKRIGGKVTFDEEDSGKPVIGLDFLDTKVVDAGLAHLKRLTKLQSLSLRNTSLTDAGLVHLKDLTRLQTLILIETEVTDGGMKYLKRLTNLHTLHLDLTKVTDAGLIHLKELTNLKTLGLAGTEVTGAGLMDLKEMKGLQNLYLHDSPVTDSGLIHLREQVNLQILSIGNTRITNDGLVHLKGLTTLQRLNLHETKVTNTGLIQLKGLTNLQMLGLGKTSVTGEGLEQLKAMADLQELLLTSTSVTDTGLIHLKGLTNLKMLNLRGSKVTTTGVSDLQTALPKSQILTDVKSPSTNKSQPSASPPKGPSEDDFRLTHDSNGNSRYVVVPTLRPDWTAPFTVESWVCPQIVTGYREFISDQQRAGCALAFYNGVCRFNLHDGQKYQSVHSLETVVPAKEIHVAGVFDGVQLNLFIDGKRQGSGTAFTRQAKLSSMPLHIGANPESGNRVINVFSGTIDEVRISDVARYQSDFTPSRRFKTDAHTLALYHFDEPNGRNAFDSSEKARHGQIRSGSRITESQATAEMAIRKLDGHVYLSEREPGIPDTTIYLNGPKVTDGELIHLKQFPNLKYLILNDTMVTATGLEHLKGLNSLQILNLHRTIVTDAGLAHLKKLTNIRSLVLSGVEVTDAGLEHLKEMTSLQGLSIYNATVSNAGLKHLKGLTNLRSLNFRNTDVNDIGITELNSVLHGCRCSILEGASSTLVNSGQLAQLYDSYRLRENESVRLFRPPFPEVRSRIVELLRRSQTPSAPSYSLFLQSRGESLPSNPPPIHRGNFTLADILQRTMRTPTDTIIDPDGLLGLQLEGDLVFSEDAESEELMRQLEELFSKSAGVSIKLEYIGIPSRTLVLEGELRSSNDGMKVTSIKVRDKNAGGFTRNSVSVIFEKEMKMPVIDETSEKVASELSLTIPIWDDGLTQSRLKNVLDSISQQSGLTAKIEEREIPRLKIATSDD